MATQFKSLYNENYIDILTHNISKNYETSNHDNFKNEVFDSLWEHREFKNRMRHISTTLGKFLPNDYAQSIDILTKAFLLMDGKFGLENMIFQDFVEVYGLDDFETSLYGLKIFTINSSSEFAIRQFIIKYPKQTMAKLQEFATSDNAHIRRLASEGSRPRLPWAVALTAFKKDPDEVFKIIELLLYDTSKYVQKSVANSLNDISKDNPTQVIAFIKKHLSTCKDVDWILKHGARTLLKNSNQKTLELFGFTQINHIKLDDFFVDKSTIIGENLNFSFGLKSTKPLGKLKIEFAIDFVRLKNKINKKVFQISEVNTRECQKKISKAYSFKPITTRKYYAGNHCLYIIVNGYTLGKKEFELKN